MPRLAAIRGLIRNRSINASAAGNDSINVNDLGSADVGACPMGTNNSQSLMRLTCTGALDLSTLGRIMFDTRSWTTSR